MKIMKRNTTQMKFTLNRKRTAGGMLLEVVLAIAVFAFGMLALVQLQGNLTRSSADANLRTVATNIAEELVENIRGFRQVAADADNVEVEFLELVGDTQDTTVTRGNVDFDVTFEIFDFWRDEANDTFVRNEATDPPTVPEEASGQAYANFKLLEITVAWNPDGQEFYVDDENTEALGLGSITIYEIIPSSPPSLGAKIAGDPNAIGGAPTVDFLPGANPDIVSLKLDDDGKRRKESTMPIPDVIRSGELTETYFEVVSYNDANVFLRREEFLTVGCECTLNPNSGASEFGLRPTIWNGVEYTEGDAVLNKDVAVSANNQQSVFCDLCCRDHHDGGTGINDNGRDANDIEFEDRRQVYNPWADTIDTSANHPHYGRTKKGEIFMAGDRDNYFESCRMVRKDGFWRVAQDFNQQAFFGVVEDYLDNEAEIAEYSDYVTTATEDFYVNSQGDLPLPEDDLNTNRFTNPQDGVKYPLLPSTDEDVTLAGPNTRLPTALGAEAQQLRARGIYLDYMTDEVEEKIRICEADADACQIPRYLDAMEIYPFFEIQLTKLSNWTEDPLNLPVDVTNEAIATNNGHSRGRADLKQTGMGKTKSDHGIHKGNSGIGATDPIIPNDPQAADEETDYVHIDTVDDGTPYEGGLTIIGEISSGVGGVQATGVEVSNDEAQCGRTPTGYKCIVPALAASPTLIISNYVKKNQTLYACSDDLAELLHVHAGDNSTTFDLSGTIPSVANIVIQNSPCLADTGP
jgi:hypothetical protein